MGIYNSKELRKLTPTEEQIKNRHKNPIYLVLDNVWDTYNIGSMFRLADAIGAAKVYLCGNMEFPPNSRIHKAAVGTENWVPWEKRDTAYEVILELKEKGVQTIAVEQSDRSISWKDYSPSFPVALVAGHESDGVTQAALEVVDVIVELPIYGFNKSFNVWGTTAVMAYKVLETLETTKKGQRS
jgi:tRNA G18 (ribose-2'-O)-methylase SpoU